MRAETILYKCVCIALIALLPSRKALLSVVCLRLPVLAETPLGIPPDATRAPQPPPLHWAARRKITLTR